MSRLIKFDNLSNTRDLGGMKTKDGLKIIPGKLIRSGHLYFASEKDLKILSDMVGVIADFRTDQELFEKPDPQLKDCEYHHIPVLSSWTAGLTWEEKQSMSEEDLMKKLQKEPALAMKYMQGIYKGFGANDFYISQYRKFVDLLLEGSDKAILWHCTAGKDRAGFATVIVQELLGIDREAIVSDYLKTNDYLAKEIKEIAEMIKAKNKDPESVSDLSMRYLFGAEPEYINAAYDKIEEYYGNFEVFIKDALKVSSDEREKLKAMYLYQG